MPDSPGIPTEVRQLLARRLESVEHVDILLLLATTAPRTWSVQEIAAELRLDNGAVARRVGDLTTAELLSRHSTEQGREERYAFSPDSVATRRAVDALHELYQLRPATVLRAIYDRPRVIAQSFADAFRVKPRGEQ